jgi:hypothetical protein
MTKNKYIDAFVNAVKDGHKLPSHAILSRYGISRRNIEGHFGNVNTLRKEATKKYPKLFEDSFEEEIYAGIDYDLKLNSAITKHKKFVITSAVNGAEMNQNFYKSIKNYCKKNKALLLVIPVEDKMSVSNQYSKGWYFDKQLKKDFVVFNETSLNENLMISSIRVKADQVQPSTGIGRFTHKKGSFIFGSTKQNLDYQPTANLAFARASMTTGAITNPKYDVTNKTKYIANNDHITGAIIVEIEDKNIYHFRQIQADKNGNFADLGKKYTSNSVKKYAPATFVLGDIHYGATDETALDCWMKVVQETGVKEVVLHDIFDGTSISHWTENNLVVRTQHAAKGLLSLEDELKLTADGLNNLTKVFGLNVVVVASNHDEFIHRYLKENRFFRDYGNYEVAAQLALDYIKGVDPLKNGLIKFGGLDDSKIKFLTRFDDYLIADIQLAAHGDMGSNGKKNPSLAGLENAYGAAVTAHSHTAGILRSIWRVGTTSKMQLGYNVGASSWTHSSCLVYPCGSRQMINSIHGKYKI